jgi:hypothetical protein
MSFHPFNCQRTYICKARSSYQLGFFYFFIILKIRVIIDLGLPCQPNHFTQLKITKDALINSDMCQKSINTCLIMNYHT